MLECVVIVKDLAYRGRVNAATIENDAWCVEKQGVFSVIRDGDLDIYKILGMELGSVEVMYILKRFSDKSNSRSMQAIRSSVSICARERCRRR